MFATTSFLGLLKWCARALPRFRGAKRACSPWFFERFIGRPFGSPFLFQIIFFVRRADMLTQTEEEVNWQNFVKAVRCQWIKTPDMAALKRMAARARNIARCAIKMGSFSIQNSPQNKCRISALCR